MSGVTTAISTAGAVGLSLLNKAPTVYSFLDLSGSMSHPLLGSYIFTGQGVGSITTVFDHERDFNEIDVNGIVVVGYVPGDNGKIQIVCQISSNVHSWLGYLYTGIKNKMKDKSYNEWARMNFYLRNVVTGNSFQARGVTFTGYPEESRAAQGSLVTWVLSFAHGVNFVSNPTGAGQMSALQKAVKSIG